jgi:ribosomal protein L12E/L44/L45/RPP1/RPP2
MKRYCSTGQSLQRVAAPTEEEEEEEEEEKEEKEEEEEKEKYSDVYYAMNIFGLWPN